MDNTQLSLEQLEGCNGGILMEAFAAYQIVKAIDGTTKERPINNAIYKAKREAPEPFKWML